MDQLPTLASAINKYFDLMYDGDDDQFFKVFHIACLVHGMRDGKLMAWTASEFREMTRGRASPAAMNSPREQQILSIEHGVPGLASAKVRVRIGQIRFIDYLIFHRIDDMVYFGATLAARNGVKKKVTIAKLTSDVGILLTTLVGCLGFAVGLCAILWTHVNEESTGSKLSAWSTFAGAVPVVGKILAQPDFNEEFEYDPVLVLGVIDFICDLAVGALTCASTFE